MAQVNLNTVYPGVSELGRFLVRARTSNVWYDADTDPEDITYGDNWRRGVLVLYWIEYDGISLTLESQGASWQGIVGAYRDTHSLFLVLIDNLTDEIVVQENPLELSGRSDDVLTFSQMPTEEHAILARVQGGDNILFVFAATGSVQLFKPTASVANIENSLNEWLSGGLDYQVLFNMPRKLQGLKKPVVGAFHQFVSSESRWQGDRVGRNTDTGQIIYGREYNGLMNITLWVNRADRDWNATLREMKTQLHEHIGRTRSVPINNYDDNRFRDISSLPAYDRTVIRLHEMSPADFPTFADPDMRGQRYMLRYTAIVRSV